MSLWFLVPSSGLGSVVRLLTGHSVACPNRPRSAGQRYGSQMGSSTAGAGHCHSCARHFMLHHLHCRPCALLKYAGALQAPLVTAQAYLVIVHIVKTSSPLHHCVSTVPEAYFFAGLASLTLFHSGYQPHERSCSGGGMYARGGTLALGARSARSRGMDVTPTSNRALQLLQWWTRKAQHQHWFMIDVCERCWWQQHTHTSL